MYTIHNNSLKSFSQEITTTVNTSPSDTVFTQGGINRLSTPTAYSGIIYRPEESPRKICKLPKWKFVNSPSYRRYPLLNVHKLDVIIELTYSIEVDTVGKELAQLLQYEKVKEKHTTGKAFTTYVLKESRGESITISYSHKEQKHYIRLITHKLERLSKFIDYTHQILRVHTIKTFTFETYVRYHEKHEYKVCKALEALDLELGKSMKNHLIPNQGKHDYYLCNAKIEYRSAKVYLKTYRHRDYKKHDKTHSEYHPKLEQSTTIHDIPVTTDLTQVIREYSILVHTIAHTLNIRTIVGEYETTTDKIKVETIDPQVARYVRGILRRIVGETILLEQLRDKRLVVAHLLVDKKLKITDIAKILGYSRVYVYRIITELLDAGVITRIGGGKYTWAKHKTELPKQEVVRHYHVRTLTELKELIETVRTQYKLIRVSTTGTVYIDYETETERIRLITNVIVNRTHVEIIDPITRRRKVINELLQSNTPMMKC